MGNHSIIRKGGLAALCLVGAVAGSSAARADLVTLTDRNTTVDFDTQSQANMYNWFVDGVDHMFQQAFWFRIGDQAPEQALTSLTHVGALVNDTDFDAGNDTLVVRYEGNGLRIDVKYSLEGGSAGSNTSDVGEQITITNISEEAIDFHFFQYNDFDLGGTIFDSSVQITGGNTATQRDELITLGEVVATPAPDQYAVGYWPTLLNALNDNAASNFGTVGGPLTNGDMSWVFQWDRVIDAGGSMLISKDKHIDVVPAPGAALLGMLGLGLVTRAKRRVK